MTNQHDGFKYSKKLYTRSCFFVCCLLILAAAATHAQDRSAPALALPSPSSGPALTVPYGHQHGIQDVFFNADDRLMITSDDENTIVWEVRSGKPLQYFSGTHPFFSPGEKYLATFAGNIIYIWDMTTGRLIHFLPQDNTVQRAVFHPVRPEMLVMSATQHQNIDPYAINPTLWNFITGKQELSFQPGACQPATPVQPSVCYPEASRHDPALETYMHNARFEPDGRHIVVDVGHSIKIFALDSLDHCTQFCRPARPQQTTDTRPPYAIIKPDAVYLRNLKDQKDITLTLEGVRSVHFNLAGNRCLMQRYAGPPIVYNLSPLSLADMRDTAALQGLPELVFVIQTNNTHVTPDTTMDQLRKKVLDTTHIPSYMQGIVTSAFNNMTRTIKNSMVRAGSNSGIIMDLRTGRTISVIRSLVPDPGDISVSSDEKSLFYRAGGLLYLYSIPDARLLGSFPATGYKCSFSANGQWLVMIHPQQGVSLLIGAATGKIYRNNKTPGLMTEANVTVSPDGSSFVLTNRIVDGGMQRVDLRSGNIIEDKKKVLGYTLSPDGRRAGYFLAGGLVSIIDLHSGAELFSGKGAGVLFSNNPAQVVIKGWDHALYIPDIKIPSKSFEIGKTVQQPYQQMLVSPNGRYLYMQDAKNVATLYDLNSRQLILRTDLHIPVKDDISTQAGRGLQKVPDANDDFIEKMVPGHSPRGASFTPAGDSLITHNQNTVTIYRCAGGRQLSAYFVAGDIRYVDVSNDILVTFQNGQIKNYKLSTGTERYTLVPFDNGEAVFVLPNGKYYGPRDAVTSMGYVTGFRTLSFQQLDAYNNRPDLVLKELGCRDECLMKMLRSSHDMRMQRSGLSATAGEVPVEAPVITILNEKNLYSDVHENRLLLKLRATDQLHQLTRISLWDNGVPVYRKDGLPVSRKKKDLDTTIYIPLSEGRNYIETSVTNMENVESYRVHLIVNYTPPMHVPQHVYFIGIGAGRYREASHDLPFVAKDIRDVASLIRDRYPGRNTIDTLINERVSLENLFPFKQHLSNAGVDDIVILYFAGHGVLDQVKRDAFFGAYDMSFDNPSEKGFSFRHFEEIFDGTPARNRAIFLDACHSGELNRLSWQQSIGCPPPKFERPVPTSDDSLNMIMRSGGNDAAGSFTEGYTPFNLMLSLFADINPGDGSYVISAAEGLEKAGENATLQNGVFTHHLLEGIKKRGADENRDDHITIGELKNYVIREVKAASAGSQRPISRKDNLSYDWVIFENASPGPASPVAAELPAGKDIQIKYTTGKGMITFDIDCPGYLPAMHVDVNDNRRIDPSLDRRYMLFNNGLVNPCFLLSDTTFTSYASSGAKLTASGFHYILTVPLQELTTTPGKDIHIKFRFYSADKGICDFPAPTGAGKSSFENTYAIKPTNDDIPIK